MCVCFGPLPTFEKEFERKTKKEILLLKTRMCNDVPFAIKELVKNLAQKKKKKVRKPDFQQKL